MKKKICTVLSAAILIITAHTGLASATYWTGTVSTSNIFANVSQFDWDKASGGATDSSLIFSSVLAELPGSNPVSSADSNFMLFVNLNVNSDISDDFFRISYLGADIVKGTLDQDSYLPGAFVVTGTVTQQLNNTVISSNLVNYGFELAGSDTGSVFDVSSNFVEPASAVPEPSSILLTGLGLLGMAAFVRKRRA
jgi:hypothetical protein